ncbi:ATP-binding protein [Dyadobacter jejuensis]|nr:ATP-binding protein [Dyadobacter jejuensis]
MFLNLPYRYKSLVSNIFTILIWLVCIGYPPIQAQPTVIANKSYHIQHYTDENGLPQNSVKKIAQDDAGFIWLGTEAGLSRYDGQKFINYSEFEYIRGIHSFEPDLSAPPQYIYAVTDQYERLRLHQGKFERVMDHSQLSKSLIKNSFSNKPKHFLTRGLPEDAEGLFFPESVQIPYSDYRLFNCSHDKIDFLRGHTLVARYPIKSDNLWHFFRLNNRLYRLADKDSLIVFDPEVSTSSYRIARIINLPKSNNQKSQIFWNNANNQSFLYVNKKLYRLNEGKNGNLIATELLSNFDFTSRQIRSVFFDIETQKLYLGSLIEGLYIIKRKQFTTINNPFSNSDDVYYAQELLNKHSIISPQGDIFNFSEYPNIKYEFNNLLSQNHRFKDKYGLIHDLNGNFWAKGFSYLYKYDHQAKGILSKNKYSDEISWIYQGKNNRLWVAFRQLGLYYLDINSQDLKPKKFIGAPLRRITWIHEALDNVLWVGTRDGLYRIELKTKKTSRINQLNGLFIRSIYNPQLDEMWITTYQNGIFLIKDNKITKFPLDNNRFLARSHCMVEDSSGFMWINTNNGLFQFKKQALLNYATNKTIPYFRYYNKSNGFNHNEFNGGCQPCALKLPNGLISFPSMDGLVVFNPKQIKHKQKLAPIVIDQVLVGKQEMKPIEDTLALVHDQGQIKIAFSNAYLGDPTNLKIYYSLVPIGTTPEWYPIEPGDHSIPLPPLKPGTYTLVIKGVGGFDKDSIITKRLTIQILKPWYLTWWAIGFFILAIVGFILLIIDLQLRRALKQNELLEGKIKERTLALQQTVLDLKNSQSELLKQNKLHTYILASITHDFRSPLKFMHAWLTEVPKEIANGEASEVSSSSQLIEKTMRHMMRLTDDMTHYLRAITTESQGSWNLVSLKPLVEDKTTLFKSLSWINKGTIKITIDPELKIKTNANLLGIVIHNLIDNAFKSKPNAMVAIHASWSTKFSQSTLELTVRDNGPGIPDELLLWLNSPPKDHIAPPQSYHGLGLAMIKSTCETLGVTLFYQNLNGTVVTLTFPPEGVPKL